MPPLFVTDLDGTLLRSDRSLSPSTAAVLNAAIGGGAGVTYATARWYYTVRSAVAEVHFRLPAIVYNGAFAIDPATGEPLHCNLLDAGVAEEAIAEGLRHGLPPFVFGLEAGREVGMHVRPVNEGRWLSRNDTPDDVLAAPRVLLVAPAGGGGRDPRLMPVATLRPPERVITVQVVAPAVELAERSVAMARRLQCEVAMHAVPGTYQPDYHPFEIRHLRANKGDMTRWAAERCGVPASRRPTGEVRRQAEGRLAARAPAADPHRIAFGHNRNDLPMFVMFEAAGTVAVANAQPEVLAAAHEVIAVNDADGVAGFIDRWRRRGAARCGGA